MMYYAVSPEGQVRSYRQKTYAQAMARQIGGLFASDDPKSLGNLPTPLIVILHNLVRPERPVTRFADRASAEKRIQGVLEVLAKPGETPTEAIAPEVEVPDETIVDPSVTLTPEETEAMATKKAAAKKPAAKKVRVPRETISIPESTVRKAIKLRADGKGWPEVLKELGEKSYAFVHRLRPLMKKLDKSSVMALGPGSTNYGKGLAKKAAAKKANGK